MNCTSKKSSHLWAGEFPNQTLAIFLETRSDVSAPVCLICPASDTLPLIWDSAWGDSWAAPCKGNVSQLPWVHPSLLMSYSAVNSARSVSSLGDYVLRSEMGPHSFFPLAQGLIFSRLLLQSCCLNKYMSFGRSGSPCTAMGRPWYPLLQGSWW